MGGDPGVLHSFATQLLPYYAWALMVPLIVHVLLRFERLRGLRWVLAHALFAALLTLAETTLLAWPTHALGYFRGLSITETWTRLFVYRGATELVHIGLIFAVIHAVLRARRVRAEELRRSNLARDVLEARLAALRGQLEPHFLLNTLNSISALSAAGDTAATEEAIAHTGDLLREALRRPDIVSLGRELEYLHLYLRIARLNRGRADVDIHVPADARRCAVPSFLLQPLVENAFKHGRRPAPGEPSAYIRARCADGRLEIVVRNPVRDPDPDPRHWLERGGIGLANTRRRLDTLYGRAADLSIAATDTAVEVRVSLPATDAE